MTVDALVGSLPLLVAFALLIAGVVGSILPAVPGAPLSVAGVLVFWWVTDDLGPVLLVALVAVGALALAVDWFGGAAAAKASGTSTLVSAVAGVVGLVGMVFGGPLGLVAGIAGTVFVATYAEERETGESLRRAVYTTAGVLASAVVQALLTTSILLTVVVVYLL